jgi:hypothetical protein
MKPFYSYDHFPAKRGWQQSHLFIGRLLMLLVLSCFAINVHAQNKITVVGQVTDTLGIKISGANVTAENVKNVGTTTDINGRFVLEVPTGTSLKISFVGFIDQHIVVAADNQHFTIRLKEQKLLAEEVVVTAFGKKERKEAVVGSVTSIKPAELKYRQVTLPTHLPGRQPVSLPISAAASRGRIMPPSLSVV